jgi:hypothetical protein
LVPDLAPEVTVSLPPLDEIALCWPILSPILQRATDRIRGYEPIDLLQLILLGRMNLFVVRDRGRIVAAAVTEVRVYPRCRVLEVPFIAGDGVWRWYRPLLAALEAHATLNECVDLVGYDRKGWSRFGFKVVGQVMVRRLKD